MEEVEGQFDLITAMEVIEHVADPRAFVAALAARLAPDGLLILSTPNRTAWSKLLTITLAEGFGRIPKGTHEFDKFIDPDAMKALLGRAGLEVIDVEGIAFSPDARAAPERGFAAELSGGGEEGSRFCAIRHSRESGNARLLLMSQ